MDRVEAIQQVRELIGGFRFAMLTTVDQDGKLATRPMVSQDIDDDGCFWFFTSKHTEKVLDIRGDARVSVSFVDSQNQRFAAITGTAQILDDPEMEHALWTPEMRNYFPDGVDAPDLVLVKVHVEHCEAWESASDSVKHVLGLVRARVTGKPQWSGSHIELDLPAA